MFVGQELLLSVSFSDARLRLEALARGGMLNSASEKAYGDGLASEKAYGDGLASQIRIGPLGGRPGISKLVRVHFRELVTHADSVVLTLRWEATGGSGALFPVLDADITLTPADEQSTRMALTGAYRPPFAALGAGLDKALLHHVATATIRSLLNRLADALSGPGNKTGVAC